MLKKRGKSGTSWLIAYDLGDCTRQFVGPIYSHGRKAINSTNCFFVEIFVVVFVFLLRFGLWLQSGPHLIFYMYTWINPCVSESAADIQKVVRDRDATVDIVLQNVQEVVTHFIK